MGIYIPFRVALFVIIFSMAIISGTFRARARRESGTIKRSEEHVWLRMVRLVFALLLYVPIPLFLINPTWMAWSEIAAPDWVRWAGVALGILLLPVIWNVFTSIGSNISETVLTKDDHELVTSGIYTRIRHPLYGASSLVLLSVSLIMVNWFVAAMSVVSIGVVLLIVIPKEETELIDRFGDQYIAYRARAGAMWPKL